MNPNTFPTKGNLILAKNSLALAVQGYGLMDKKRNILLKELTARLATVETSAYRLAESIKKTQKRANALKNITIPSYQALVTEITNALEEKDREEFTRLKVIKRSAGK